MGTKGMVLAAGFGTRLSPMTNYLPKPMFPICNIPMIDFALKRLAERKIKSVAVNLHHLPMPISTHLKDGGPFNQQIDFSEEPQILGTGGGIKAVREWCGPHRLCVTNSDALLMADLKPVFDLHEKSGALATMAIMEDRRVERYGAVSTDEQGRVTDIGDKLEAVGDFRRGIFVGFHIIEPELFNRMPDRDHFCIVRDVYLPLIKSDPGAVRAAFVEGMYFDAGTPSDYLVAHYTLLQNAMEPTWWPLKGLRHLGENVYVGKSVMLERNVSLKGPCIVGDGVSVGGGSEIGPMTVVGAGARLGPWTRLMGCVAWPDAKLIGGGFHSSTILYDREYMSVDGLIE